MNKDTTTHIENTLRNYGKTLTPQMTREVFLHAYDKRNKEVSSPYFFRNSVYLKIGLPLSLFCLILFIVLSEQKTTLITKNTGEILQKQSVASPITQDEITEELAFTKEAQDKDTLLGQEVVDELNGNDTTSLF